MAVWREEKPVPTQLPAARLFLEDLEEIVKIFLRADENRATKIQTGKEDQQVTIEFKIVGQVCDRVDDLPKVAKRTTNLELELTKKPGLYRVLFGISKYSTQWHTIGLSKEEAWAAFRQLEVLFENRKRYLRNFLVSQRLWLPITLGVIVPLLVFGLLVLLYHGTPIKILPPFLIVSTTLVLFLLWTVLRQHSVVILRNSWDHAANREELKLKIIAGTIPALIGATLGIGGTLLAFYIRHKYWP